VLECDPMQTRPCTCKVPREESTIYSHAKERPNLVLHPMSKDWVTIQDTHAVHLEEVCKE